MLENFLNKATSWVWGQKEWLFDGIGTTLLVTVAIPALIWFFRYLKKKVWSTKKDCLLESPPNSPSPAFDLDDSQARIIRTSIIGKVPSGLLKASNGSSIEFTDSLIVSNQNNVDFPKPTQLYINKSPQELKFIANEVAVKLLEFDSTIANDIESLSRNGDFSSEKYSALSSTHNNLFNEHLRVKALEVMSEILDRLEPINRPSLPIETRCGIDAALYGKLTGSHPARGLANFLITIAEKLAP